MAICKWLQLGIVCAATSGSLGNGNYAIAQIVPDSTLPNNSNVTTEGNTFNITGGSQAGSNLFHSFQEFSIPTNSIASFKNATDVQNILTRVTGGAISNIDGLIKVNGTANLFLINPNGIVFGRNASLDLGGSFLASTANSIQFADGTEFRATASQTTPLLTMSVPMGLQFPGNSGSIINQSLVTNSNNRKVGLQVQNNKSLVLVGGNVNLDGGIVTAVDGRVELGGLAGAGTVGLQVDGNNLNLSFTDNAAKADVSLSNESEVSVIGGNNKGDGSIAINARNINIFGESLLNAGILGTSGNQAKDIILNATEAIKVNGQKSFIENVVGSNAIGNGGNIQINTGSLEVTNGARLNTSTKGKGNAGNVIINARDSIKFDGVNNNDLSAAFSRVEEGAEGNSGVVEINTGSLEVTDGAQLSVATLGRGNGGRMIIDARDTVKFDRAYAFTGVGKKAEGNGGDLKITAGRLDVINGAQLSVTTNGQGNAGNAIIKARDTVRFDGEGRNSQGDITASAASSSVEAGAVGQAGSIQITTGILDVTNGAVLSVRTRGTGNAGSLIINANNVNFDGNGIKVGVSNASSRVEKGAVGNSGRLEINTDTLNVTNGAQLNASTAGQGVAGDVIINALDTVKFARGYASGSVGAGAIGKGGNIQITTGTLDAINGAQLSVATDGQGDAGNVIINARDTIKFDGKGVNSEGTLAPSSIFSSVSKVADGRGGTIQINTGRLYLTNGAQLNTNTRGKGNAGSINIVASNNVNISEASSGFFVRSESTGSAGNIEVNAPLLVLDKTGRLIAESNAGQGGNMTLNLADALVLRRNSLISATAGTQQGGGDGGNITINIPDGFIIAFPNQNTDIKADAFTGSGGRISITAFDFFNIEPLSRDDLVRLLEPDQPLDPQRLQTNNITAISQITPELNGEVDVIAPDVDPNRGLIQLPEDLGDSSIPESCPVDGARGTSQYFITGRGGLPPDPSSPLSSEVLIGNTTNSPGKNRLEPNNPTFVEAQGVEIGTGGKIIFTDKPSKYQPRYYNSLQRNIACYGQ